MIRPETMTDYAHWTQPTGEEISELLDECSSVRGVSLINFAAMIGVSYSAVALWKTGKSKITYSTWALLCYMAGKGDIVTPENTEEDIQKKIARCHVSSSMYKLRLINMIQVKRIKNALKKEKKELAKKSEKV